MKKNRTKDLFLEQLRKIPIIQVSCEKCNIARSTVYKWRDEDEEFRTAMEQALIEGEALLNELGENQLYSLMLEKHWPAIQFWLKHRNTKFKEKIEITARRAEIDEELSPEQNSFAEQILTIDELSEELLEENNQKSYEENNTEKNQENIEPVVGSDESAQDGSESASEGGAA